MLNHDSDFLPVQAQNKPKIMEPFQSECCITLKYLRIIISSKIHIDIKNKEHSVCSLKVLIRLKILSPNMNSTVWAV